ncbi:MAG: condensation domain-containing protein, partial [Bacillota bacterium]
KQEVNHTFIDVVKQMQKDSLESARYDYYPLADIQSLSEVNQELVHHIIIFQNYYSDDQVYDVVEDVGFKISESNVYEQTNYDFDVMVLPKDVLEITFSYNKELYDKTSVIKFKNQFTKILQTIIETVEVEVADINILTELDSQK